MKENVNEFDTLKSARKWLVAGLILIALAPLILTLPAYWSKLDFSTTSSIGDTIGGITSPIVGVLGSILIFYALIEQVRANKLLQNQIKEQSIKESLEINSREINQLYNNLKSSIDNFTYVSLDVNLFGQGQYLTGSEAIYKLFNDFYCDCHISEDELEGNPKITELTSILEICDVILNKISISTIPDKDVLNILTIHQFRYRIYPRLKLDIENLSQHRCDICEKDHGLPERLVELINNLITKTKEN